MNTKILKKRFCLPIVAILLTTYSAGIINAENLTQQLNEVQQQIGEQSSKKAEAEQRIQNFSARLKEVQDALEQANRELRKIQAQRQEIEIKIAKNEEELKKAQERYQKRMKILEKRVRDIYENGQLSYLDVILGAKNFSDFATRVELFKRLINSDIELIKAIQAEREAIEKKKAELEADRQAIVALEKEAEAKKAIIVQKKAEEESLLEQARTDRDTALAAIEELEASSNAIKAKLQALENSRRSSSGEVVDRGYVQGSGRFIWPTSGPITSEFGYRIHPIYGRQILHSGIDIGVPTGTVIHAADSGTVVLSGWVSGYGYTVIIDHGNGFSTLYAHNSELLVSEGQSVSQGEAIAHAGSTGNSTGPHLHFEVRINGEPQNPLNYL